MSLAGQDFFRAPSFEGRLVVAIALNAVIVLAEVIGGFVSGSLALLSDAVHNFSDVAALTIAFIARQLGKRPPSPRHTYGLARIEVMAALFNGATILVVGTLIVRSAVVRLWNPEPVLGGIMLIVATIGLIANVLSVLLLKGHSRSDLNMRAAGLHLLQDTLSSVAVVGAALLAAWRYGPYLDPLVSILVVLFVAVSGWRLLRDAIRVLLEGTPEGLDLQALQADVQSVVPHCGLHHLHVWELRPDQRILTAHLQLCDDLPLSRLEELQHQVRERLRVRWGIAHSTLQPELAGCGHRDLLGAETLCGAGAGGEPGRGIGAAGNKIATVFLLLTLAWPQWGAGAPPDALTLSEAIAIALDRNPDVAEALSRLREAEARLEGVAAGGRPSLKARGMYDFWTEDQRLWPATKNGEPGVFGSEIGGAELVASVPLYTGGRITAEITSAKQARESAKNQWMRAREMLVFQVSSTFYGLLAQEEVVRAVETALQAMEEQERTVEAMVEAGKAARVDLLRARVRRAELYERKVRETNNQSLQQRAWAALLGLEDPILPRAIGRLEDYEPDLCSDSAECIERAFARRADYRAARATVSATEAAVRAARAGYFPTLSVQASYGTRWMRDPSDQPQGASDQEEIGRAAIVAELPLFDGRLTAARVAEQSARLQAARERLRKLEVHIRYEIESALADIASARERIRTARGAGEQADESFRIVKQKYDLGKGTISDVLDAQTALTAAQTSLARALADLAVADSRRRLFIGEILP